MEVKIEDSWKKVLSQEFEKDYFVKLADFVKDEYRISTIYPSAKFIFRAFEMTPFDKKIAEEEDRWAVVNFVRTLK